MNYAQKQKGFSLFMVMIIMLVIALMVVVTTQTATTEMRISTNESDRKYALSLAENSLRDAEFTIQNLFAESGSSSSGSAGSGSKTTVATFTYDCNKGFCMPVEPINYDKTNSYYKIDETASNGLDKVVAYKRTFNNQSVFDTKDKYKESVDKKSRYIIEFLGESKNATGATIYTFRVTTRAKGENPNTVVLLQSYVEMAN